MRNQQGGMSFSDSAVGKEKNPAERKDSFFVW
jgi:hypothetical protein